MKKNQSFYIQLMVTGLFEPVEAEVDGRVLMLMDHPRKYFVSIFLGIYGWQRHWFKITEGIKYQVPVDFEEVLKNSSPEVQEKIVFHLDLFRTF